jgi:hypothetical protein
MRKLNLKKETLAELTAEELDLVVGAANEITQPQCVSGIVSCVTYRCPTFRDCQTVVNC